MKSPLNRKMKAPMKKLDEPTTTKRETGRKGRGGWWGGRTEEQEKGRCFVNICKAKLGVPWTFPQRNRPIIVHFLPPHWCGSAFKKKKEMWPQAPAFQRSVLTCWLSPNCPKRTKTFSSPTANSSVMRKRLLRGVERRFKVTGGWTGQQDLLVFNSHCAGHSNKFGAET